MIEQALNRFMINRHDWEGTSSELLSLLEDENLPLTPKGLSQYLRAQPIAGLAIEFHRTKAARVLRIRKVTQAVTPALF
jgi:hypothetical protein